MTREPGIRAQGFGVCERCERVITEGDRIVPHGGGWIHSTCASGGDDE